MAGGRTEARQDEAPLVGFIRRLPIARFLGFALAYVVALNSVWVWARIAGVEYVDSSWVNFFLLYVFVYLLGLRGGRWYLALAFALIGGFLAGLAFTVEYVVISGSLALEDVTLVDNIVGFAKYEAIPCAVLGLAAFATRTALRTSWRTVTILAGLALTATAVQFLLFYPMW